MIFKGNLSEFLEVQQFKNLTTSCNLPSLTEGELCIIWFCQDQSKMIIDTQSFTFNKNQVICLTSFNKVNTYHLTEVRYIRFNKLFYCVLSHHSEASCKGILYYGASEIPVFNLCEAEQKRLENFWQILLQEMNEKDNLQLEMLQMLLKQILIICLRLYKKNKNWENENIEQINIIRDFNFLVETHFKKLHRVEDYAKKLHKSPKTLSNIFKKLTGKSPLQLIRERIFLEAKRNLYYTELPISEIGYDLGYDDLQSFSRFFKKMQGVSPAVYREIALKEKMPIHREF